MKNNLIFSVVLFLASGAYLIANPSSTTERQHAPAPYSCIDPYIDHQMFNYYNARYFLPLCNPNVSEGDKVKIIEDLNRDDVNLTDGLIYHYHIDLFSLIIENKLSKSNQELLISKFSDHARQDLAALVKQSNTIRAKLLQYVRHNTFSKTVGQFGDKIKDTVLHCVRYCKSMFVK